jgi:two-component system, LytTR family, sensor histidine kinase AgrC
MLIHFIVNCIDTFNIVYLWITLTKKNNNMLKLLFSVLILSTLITVDELLGIHFFVSYILTIVAFKIFYKMDLKDAILGFFFVVSIQMLLQLMLIMLINGLNIEPTIMGVIVELIISIITVTYSKMKISKKISYNKIENGVLIYFTSTLSLYVIICKIVWNEDNNLILNNIALIVLVLTILTISQIVIYLYIINMIKESEKLRISNEYNIVINEIVQEIKQRQHDFVNYKNTIKGIIEVVDEKEIKQAIIDYIKDEDMNDNHINDLVYIDNVVVRSVVYNNLVKARKCDVNIKYTIENKVLDDILSYHEISNLLNNLLNNAFDEVMKHECINRNIEIDIFREKNISHLIIKNQIAKNNDINLNEIFKRGYSTKNVEGTRGYGWYNVQQIVNANKGYIKLNIENREFVFDIYFNNSSG